MSRYVWCNERFDGWIRDQIKLLQGVGLKSAGTDTITRILVDRVLIPNDVKLIDIIKPHIKIKKGVKEICSEI